MKSEDVKTETLTAVGSSDLFGIPMRPWERIEPDVTRMAKARHETQDDWTLKALHGPGARGKSRRELINRLVKRDVQYALNAWSRDISAGRQVSPNAL